MFITERKLNRLLGATEKSIRSTMEIETNSKQRQINDLQRSLNDLRAELSDTKWMLENPKMYKIGQNVSGYIIYDIVKERDSLYICSDVYRWCYMSINKKGDKKKIYYYG